MAKDDKSDNTALYEKAGATFLSEQPTVEDVQTKSASQEWLKMRGHL